MRARDRLARLLGSWRADAILAAGLVIGTLLYEAALGQLHSANALLENCCGIGVFACLIPRRAYPRLAALGAAAFLVLASFGNTGPLPGAPPFLVVLLLGYSLGAADGIWLSAAVQVCLGLATQLATGFLVFNPFIVVVIVGPFAVGQVVRSRRRITDQLAARSRELESERERFAAEAVRYERTRIARELHDIVAHCISVMVIQAGAGQRLAEQDPALAVQALDTIAEVVQQAESEISRLVELLEHDNGPRGLDGIRLVDELVARAGAAGLAVTCRFSGSADGLSQAASEAAYRVVQESLTNALKHAPGAPVDVVIAEAGGELELSIANGAPTAPPSGLERTGGGRGLAGMRERVSACGGQLTVGPLKDGGWRVLATLPCTPHRVQTSSTA
jgi:signal transduction histidine kinase